MENLDKLLQERKEAEEKEKREKAQREQNETLVAAKKTIEELQANTQQVDFVRESLSQEDRTVQTAKQELKKHEDALGVVAEKYGITPDEIIADESLKATKEVQSLVDVKKFEADLSANRTAGNPEVEDALLKKMRSLGIQAAPENIASNIDGVLNQKKWQNEKAIADVYKEREAVIENMAQEYSYDGITAFRNLSLKDRNIQIDHLLADRPVDNFSNDNKVLLKQALFKKFILEHAPGLKDAVEKDAEKYGEYLEKKAEYEANWESFDNETEMKKLWERRDIADSAKNILSILERWEISDDIAVTYDGYSIIPLKKRELYEERNALYDQSRLVQDELRAFTSKGEPKGWFADKSGYNKKKQELEDRIKSLGAEASEKTSEFNAIKELGTYEALYGRDKDLLTFIMGNNSFTISDLKKNLAEKISAFDEESQKELEGYQTASTKRLELEKLSGTRLT